MPDIVIETCDLSKEYIREQFHVLALEDVSIEIERGELLP